jgi:hypothetical protein
MRKQTIGIALALVVATFGITRYVTINVVIADAEKLITECQRRIALSDRPTFDNAEVQEQFSELRQHVFFSHGPYQWRMGLTICCLVAGGLLVGTIAARRGQ